MPRRRLSRVELMLLVIISTMAMSVLIGDEIRGFTDGLYLGFTDGV